MPGRRKPARRIRYAGIPDETFPEDSGGNRPDGRENTHSRIQIFMIRKFFMYNNDGRDGPCTCPDRKIEREMS